MTDEQIEPTETPLRRRLPWQSLRQPPMLYPNAYVWFVFFSTLDIMFTWKILQSDGGEEVNPVARIVIDLWGLPGAILFKFDLVLAVIIICEIVGRVRPPLAYRLIVLAIGVSAIPPFYALGLMWISRLEGAF